MLYQTLRFLRKFRFLRKPTEDIWKRQIMRRFRNAAGFLGSPLDHLTDQEIEERAAHVQEQVSNLGVTVEEACRAFEEFIKAFKEAQEEGR